MSRQFFNECMAWETADGTAIANTTTETIIFPNLTIPANYMSDGRALRVSMFGKHSTTGTPTLVFATRWGGVSGTLLATTETFTTGSGVSNANWKYEYILQTRVNGASGSLICMGDCDLHTGATTMLTTIFGVSGFDAPAAVSVALNADTALSDTADWGTANAANTLTGMIKIVESLN